MDNRMSNSNGNNNGNMNRNNNNRNNDNRPNKNGNKNPRSGIIICLVLAVVVFMGFSYMNSQFENLRNIEIGYSDFISMLDSGNVKSVVLTNTKIKITPVKQPYSFDITYYTGRIGSDLELVQRLENARVQFKAEVQDTSSSIVDFFLVYILPLLLFWVIIWFFYRMMSKNGGGVMGVGKSNAKVYVEKKTGVTFKDVAGQDEAKESMTELVDFLHNPGKYTQIGAKLPKGALLVGPPGTGKTLLAKAVAGEANVPFFSLSGSSFVEMFVGVGASRVRDLFKQAQQMAPCIIFIDEIDAIGKSRDSQVGGGNDEREQTLNQLLAEMDGFDSSKGLVVLAATNRPDVLDKALLRPGRFDRRIIVDKPDLKGRVEILKVHAKNVRMDETVDFDAIALATSGAVGSDLANMINEAAIMAVKAGRFAVSQSDLFEAVEVVIAGKEKKDRILGKEEKKIVASHEVGHALVAALQKHAEPVQKITIVPRTMGALGYVMQVPEEEKYLMSKKEMITDITTFCGGRAAEELCFESITSGASNDIEQATKLARAMVTQYGMSEKLGFVGLESVQNRYLDGRAVMNCSEETATEIDREVREIIAECYENAKKMLEENLDVLHEIADYLYEKETITGKQFMEILHRIKGETEEQGTTNAEVIGSVKDAVDFKISAEKSEENKAANENAQGQQADKKEE